MNIKNQYTAPVNPNREKRRKRFLRKAVVLGVSIGLIVAGTAVNTDSDLSPDDISGPAPIVQVIDDSPATTEEKKQVEKEFVHDVSIRGLLSIVLGAVGALIVGIGEMFWHIMLSPIGSFLLSWGLTSLVAVGSLAAGLKAMFPDIPLKELLTGKRVGGVLLGTFVVCCLAAILPLFFPAVAQFVAWAKVIGIALMFVIVYFALFRRIGKRKVMIPVPVED